MKVLVCGGRYYRDGARVREVLSELHESGRITHLIEGGATGADYHGHVWALLTPGVQSVRCPANWALHGPSAGPMRNAAMLELRPDRVVAFPGNKGTADMVRQARAAGVDVLEVT